MMFNYLFLTFRFLVLIIIFNNQGFFVSFLVCHNCACLVIQGNENVEKVLK